MRYDHVTYMFRNESTLYSFLNFKEFFVPNMYDVWNLSDSNGIRNHNHLVYKRLVLQDCDGLWVLICKVDLTVWSFHVTHTLQDDFTHYSCLNIKELFATNSFDIWILSDSSSMRTHKHLVCKQSLNHLAKMEKLLRCVMSTFLYGAFDCILSSCHIGVSEQNYNL